MDIKINNESGKFKFRVCGIIKKNNKFLIQKIMDNTFYCLPGGHVELGEDTLSTLQREMLEEIGIHTTNEKLLAVMENLFKSDNKPFHELAFYYLVEPLEDIGTNDFSVEEIDKGELKHLEYKWTTKEELIGLDFRPSPIKDLLFKSSETLEHIVYKEN